MNILHSKIFTSFSLISLMFILSCDKKIGDSTPVLISEETYNPKTICDCNDDGIRLLNDILSKRTQFKTLDHLSANETASEHINVLKKNWKVMQYKCLKQFGPAMMKPAGCNQPREIQSIKEQLFKLGVRT